MRFKTFLTEGYTYPLKQVADKIRNDCKPFLRMISNKPLLRGMPGTRVVNGEVVEHSTTAAHFFDHPVNRPAKDSDPDFNWMFNAMFDLEYNEELIRRRCLFTTGSESLARVYGQIHFIFPVGELDYAWSPQISDSYEDAGTIRELIAEYINHSLNEENWMDSRRTERFFQSLMMNTKAHPHTWCFDLDGKAESQTEEAMRETPMTDERMEEILTLLDRNKTTLYHEVTKAMMKATSELYKDSKNLQEAIESGNEILFFRSRGYYAVPSEMVWYHMNHVANRRVGRYEYDEQFKFLMDEIHRSGSKEITVSP